MSTYKEKNAVLKTIVEDELKRVGQQTECLLALMEKIGGRLEEGEQPMDFERALQDVRDASAHLRSSLRRIQEDIRMRG